jgi:hypothetical protein
MIQKKLILACSAICILFSSICGFAAEVNLLWDASSGNPIGYRVYYGTTQGSHPYRVDVGNVTEYTLTGLEEGVTYYFVARAYNDAGESGDSNEVSWISSTSDTEAPNVTITGPSSTSMSVINLTGTASDNQSVSEVTWVNNRGGNGVAEGTTNWSVTGISLMEGENVITVSARDPAGNVGNSTLNVVFTAPSGTIEVEFGDASSTDYPNSVEDTFINSGFPITNYSTGHLEIYTWPANTNANSILSKWDVSGIPNNAVIQSAFVYCYLSGAEGSGGDDLYEISVHKIVNHNPEISVCTWSTYNGVTQWTGGTNGGQNDIAEPEDVKMIDKTDGYKHWDVRQMVRDWVSSPLSNYGMMLRSDQGTNKASSDTNRIFVSTENEDESKRPKLVVVYSIDGGVLPPPVPPSGVRLLR